MKQVRGLEARARQQAAVASFGQRALSGVPLAQLFGEAVQTIAETLDIELCKILRLLPGEQALQLEAGVGWEDGMVGRAQVGTDRDSQAGYTLRSNHPVVVEDLPTETRFRGPPLLREAGVISGMSVVIGGEDGRPWGVLGTHSREHRDFSADDVNFLQAMANSVGAAIARNRTEQRLRELNESLEKRVAERTAEIEERAAQLQALTSELTQTEQRERRRLAEALHDNLQQLLVASKLQIGTASGAAGEVDAITEPLNRASELLERAIQESRSLTVELSPPVLYEHGLTAGLEWLGRWMREQHGLTVQSNASDDAEPASEDLRVLLFQSARELLFNVLKHAGADCAEVALRRGENRRVELLVCDRGCGFALSSAETESLSSTNKGEFGLLSIRERVARFGGEFEIVPRDGGGTYARITVPESESASPREQRSALPANDAPSLPPTPRDEAPGDSGKIRVVLADDHDIVREGLASVLRAQPDLEVVDEARDGEAAVNSVRHHRPHVVVLDVTMPRMNGIEAARVITGEFPEVGVIGLSVHQADEMITAMLKAGAAEYLNKNGSFENLFSAIRRCTAMYA